VKTRGATAFLVLASVALVSCTSSTGATASPSAVAPSAPQSAAASGGAGTAVAVTLKEWAVANDPPSVAAGSITFTAMNEGPDDPHEFVVIRTDLPLTDLPTDATGAVDEAGQGIEVKGEIEDIAVGASGELTLDLEPGAYVLICNIYDDAEKEAHYAEGMRSAMTVTE
jgi:uncharacterized cupredoxin-like copper-binding protein